MQQPQTGPVQPVIPSDFTEILEFFVYLCDGPETDRTDLKNP